MGCTVTEYTDSWWNRSESWVQCSGWWSTHCLGSCFTAWHCLIEWFLNSIPFYTIGSCELLHSFSALHLQLKKTPWTQVHSIRHLCQLFMYNWMQCHLELTESVLGKEECHSECLQTPNCESVSHIHHTSVLMLWCHSISSRESGSAVWTYCMVFHYKVLAS